MNSSLPKLPRIARKKVSLLSCIVCWIAIVPICLAPCETKAQVVDYFTAQITAELRALDPVAADLFQEARAVRDRGEFAQAETLFRQVLARQPLFYHAKTRLSEVLVYQKRYTEAILMARQALEDADTPATRSTLLLTLTRDPAILQQHREEAVAQANALLQSPGLDPGVAESVCVAAERMQELSLLQRGTAYLQRHSPNAESTLYFSWAVALAEHDWEAAEAAIERAREMGVRRSMVNQMRMSTDKAGLSKSR